jgi:hypothetical protein
MPEPSTSSVVLLRHVVSLLWSRFRKLPEAAQGIIGTLFVLSALLLLGWRWRAPIGAFFEQPPRRWESVAFVLVVGLILWTVLRQERQMEAKPEPEPEHLTLLHGIYWGDLLGERHAFCPGCKTGSQPPKWVPMSGDLCQAGGVVGPRYRYNCPHGHATVYLDPADRERALARSATSTVLRGV